jgi:hypothetical protein
LGFEGLERRELLAGNVNAGLDVNGNLVINGDGGNNHIAIYQGFFGQIAVAGGTSNGAASGNTRVNGSEDAQQFNTTGGLIIDMGDGNDVVVVTTLTIQGEVNVSMGNDADQFGIVGNAGLINFTQNGNVSFDYRDVRVNGSVTVFGNGGNDDMTLNDTVITGNMVFTGGNGNDNFSQFGADIEDNEVRGNFFVRGGNGNDVTSVRRLEVGGGLAVFDGQATIGSTVTLVTVDVNLDIRLFLSVLDDAVVIQGEDNLVNRFQVRDIVLSTGDGHDLIDIVNGGARNIRIDTGAGDEGNGFFGVEVRNVALVDELAIDTGAGFDNVLLEDITTPTRIIVRTEGGSDGIIARRIDAFRAIYDTGTNDDVVGLYNSLYDFLVVFLGDGNDQLAAQNLTVTQRARYDGGTGFNVYNDRGGNSYAILGRINI